jgi:two-component system sensor histidine kinase MprB
VSWWTHPDGTTERGPWRVQPEQPAATGAVSRSTAERPDPSGVTAEHWARTSPWAERLDPWRARLASMSLRTRVTALAAAGVGIAVTVVAVAAYVTVHVQLHRQLDATLVERARAAVSSPLGDPTRLVQVPAEALGAADVRIAVVRADGTAFSAEGEANAPPVGGSELAIARGRADLSVRTASTEGREFRVVAVPAARGYALVLAQPTQPTERTLARLGFVLFAVGLGGVALAAYAGLQVARQGLRPVQRLTAAAEHVARTEELRPIAVEGKDELARLAGSFNAMLAALAQSRERQRRLVADAGHELRTPLTSLRTNLDLLVQSERQPGHALAAQDRSELLDDVRAQVEELSGLVSDLVELARDDVPQAADEPVDLSDVVDRAVERARRRAPEVRFDVRAEPWTVRGDPQTLERAVLNLLDNAAKWSPSGGAVTVRLIDGALTVADEGPGIHAADLPYVFDRFYRAAEARSLPGSGLGLAIVRQAVERHGGTVQAGRSPSGGALLTLELPGSSSPALGPR